MLLLNRLWGNLYGNINTHSACTVGRNATSLSIINYNIRRATSISHAVSVFSVHAPRFASLTNTHTRPTRRCFFAASDWPGGGSQQFLMSQPFPLLRAVCTYFINIMLSALFLFLLPLSSPFPRVLLSNPSITTTKTFHFRFWSEYTPPSIRQAYIYTHA